ncbi:MAG: YdcF family protein [Pseudomonadota bacterium]
MGLIHALLRICALALIAAGPLGVLVSQTDIRSPETARSADAALVFGALVRESRISPLHAERLDTAAKLLESGKIRRIVVSNAPRAASVMSEYLVGKGVPRSAIEIDPDAIKTPHTCANELDRAEARDVILISQRFHLPRIAYQCRKLGLVGQYVEADRPVDEITSARSPLAVFRIRAVRYAREAVLVWASLIEAYPARPT